MRSRWRSVAGAAILVVAAGCGGGGGKGADPVGLPPAPGPAADAATARSIVLQQADMPAGWRGAAHTETPTEVASAAAIATCLGRPDPQTTRSAIVYGPDLSMGQTQASTISTVLNTAQDAGADLAATRGPRYADCVTTAFRDDVRRQVPAATVEGLGNEPLLVETFGDGSVGIRLSAALVYPDHTDRLYADLVYISKGRATLSATFFSFSQPFPASLEESLVSRVGHRVAAA